MSFFNNLLISFEAISMLLLVAASGFVLVRVKILDDSSLKTLTRMMIDLIVPSALLVSMLKGFNEETLAMSGSLIIVPALFIPLSAITTILWLKHVHKNKGRPQADSATAAVSSIPNSFYIPYPLAAAVTPPEHLTLVTVLLGAAVLAINPIQWTMGTWLIMGQKEHESKRSITESLKHMVNGPVLGVTLGAALAFVPGFAEAAKGEEESILILRLLFSAMEMVGQAMGPMAMIITGALIASTRLGSALRFRLLFPVIMLRFLIVPGITLFLLKFGWVPATGWVAFVLLLEASSPPAMNLALVARRYDGDWEVVSALQLVSNGIALVTLPIWMSIGLQFVTLP